MVLRVSTFNTTNSMFLILFFLHLLWTLNTILQCCWHNNQKPPFQLYYTSHSTISLSRIWKKNLYFHKLFSLTLFPPSRNLRTYVCEQQMTCGKHQIWIIKINKKNAAESQEVWRSQPSVFLPYLLACSLSANFLSPFSWPEGYFIFRLFIPTLLLLPCYCYG